MEKYSSFSATVGDLVFKLPPLGIGPTKLSKARPSHIHGTFEIHIVYDEKVIFEVDKSIITLNPNDYMLIFPNTTHRLISYDKPATVYSFRFTLEKSSKHSDTNYYSTLSEYDEKWISATNPLITEYINKILTLVSTEPLFSVDKIKAVLMLLFTEILTPIFKENADIERISQTTSEYDHLINQIGIYFNFHYMEDISLSHLASNLSLSRKQTQHIIKKAFGTNFRECLSKIRLENAKGLLAETGNDVKDIAESVGYKSYNGFYLAFKSKFGITPIEYREEKKQSKNPDNQ